MTYHHHHHHLRCRVEEEQRRRSTEQQHVLEGFVSGALLVIFATCAFGLGVNKRGVRQARAATYLATRPLATLTNPP